MSIRQLPVFFQHFIMKQFKYAPKVKESYWESLYSYYLDPTIHILFLFKSLFCVYLDKKKIALKNVNYHLGLQRVTIFLMEEGLRYCKQLPNHDPETHSEWVPVGKWCQQTCLTQGCQKPSNHNSIWEVRQSKAQ